MNAVKRAEGVDRAGAVASSLCAVHCAICALLPAAFGALGLGFLLGHSAEWILSLVAVAFAGSALVMGWRRHRSTAVACLLVLGIVGLLASRGLEMGGEHDHHDSQAAHHVEEDHHGEHDEHVSAPLEVTHLAGTGVGVVGGLLLLSGHILNLRASRRCREDCACP